MMVPNAGTTYEILSHYRALTPVSFPVSQPSGVWMPVPREPTPPAPRDSGLDEANDSFLAFAASCTGMTCYLPTDHHTLGVLGLTCIVDLFYIRFQYESALDDLGEYMMHLLRIC